MPADKSRALQLARLAIDDAAPEGERVNAGRALARLVIALDAEAQAQRAQAPEQPRYQPGPTSTRVTVDVNAAMDELLAYFAGNRRAQSIRRIVKISMMPQTMCRCGAQLRSDGRCQVSGLSRSRCQA